MMNRLLFLFFALCLLPASAVRAQEAQADSTGYIVRVGDVAPDFTVTLTDEAKRFIAHASYTPAYGARPVKRYLQKYVETELAAMLRSMKGISLRQTPHQLAVN